MRRPLTVCLRVRTGVASYLADAELQLKAHSRQLDLSKASSWVPSIDNMGFAAGATKRQA